MIEEAPGVAFGMGGEAAPTYAAEGSTAARSVARARESR
jgi:hypothetical protein